MVDYAPPRAGMNLIFDDEFNRDTLLGPDGKVWDTSLWWGGRTITGGYQKQFFIDKDYVSKNGVAPGIDPFALSDGVLTINATQTPTELLPEVENYKYLSGIINTYNTFSFMYGYVEIRAQATAGKGFMPAQWMLRTDQGTLGEIDLMEVIGSKPNKLNSTIHYQNLDGTSVQANVVRATTVDLSQAMHTYGVDWREDTITFYLDGVKMGEMVTPDAMKAWMYLLTNLTVGGILAGNPDATTPWPGQYKIDYIRVWQDPGATPSDPMNKTGSDLVDTLAGGAGNDTISGLGGNDTLQGGNGDDLLLGGDGDDRIAGDFGNDTLDGGAGIDNLLGGAGNDTYIVDNSADVIFDGQGLGYDKVLAGVDYTLTPKGIGGYLEELIYTGVGSFRGEGNAFAQIITGGKNADTLIGNGGNDTLNGAAGNDSLSGGDGDDRLDGGVGADVMDGGVGNDFYIVNHSGDVVIEASDAGIDTVQSSLNYVLGTDVENLILTGSAAIGTGNELANVILGNSAANNLRGLSGDDSLNGGGGNDTLDGGEGNDTLDGGGAVDQLFGGAGDDVFIIAQSGDTAFENIDEGHDVVRAAITYALGENIEDLILTGTGGLKGTGNALDNVITGNAGGNSLNGRAGADTLYGGDGIDSFVLQKGEATGDVILDFTGAGVSGGDRLLLQGYATGAKLVYDDALALWNVQEAGVTVDHFTMLGITKLIASDYAFIT